MSEAESYYQERLLRGVMTKAFQLDYDVLIFTSFVKVSFLKAVSVGEMQIYDAINYDKLDGVIVLADVDPDSPAMAAGIQIGDIICEASGEEIKDIAAYQNIVIGSSVGETMEFVGKRLGSDGYVNIKFSVVTTEKEEVK